MKWIDFEYNGEILDLSHLHPFSWFLLQDKEGKHPARKYSFNVEFSMHCFTKQLLPAENPSASLIYRGPKEERVFCFERYELSRQLPAIIMNIDKSVCWHTHHGHFFTIELQNRHGVKVEYEVYFDVYKSGKGWLTLIVKSAYIRDAQHGTTQPRKRKIRFGVIARNRFEGKKLRPPR